MKKINCILLVDDDLAGNAFHTILIKQSGACNTIRTATNGRKALDYLIKSEEKSETNPWPDIIYLDINMPGMNGFEFLAEYKKLNLEMLAHSKIIMLTSSLNPDDKLRAMNLKLVSGFQNKPLTLETIEASIDINFN